MFKSAAFSYSAFGNLLQPLVNFGRIQAAIDIADAQQKEAYLAFEKAVLEALRETETALTRYLQEEVRRQTLALSVTDQRESVRLSQLRYQEVASRSWTCWTPSAPSMPPNSSSPGPKRRPPPI